MFSCETPECFKGQIFEARWKLQQWRPDLDRDLFEEEIIPRTPRKSEAPQLLTAMSPRKEAVLMEAFTPRSSAPSSRSSAPSSPRKRYGRQGRQNGGELFPIRTPVAVRNASPRARARHLEENLFPPGMDFTEEEQKGKAADDSEEEVQAPRKDRSRIKSLIRGDAVAEPEYLMEPGIYDAELMIVPDVEEENPPDCWEPPPKAAPETTDHLGSVHPTCSKRYGLLWEENDVRRAVGLPEGESKELSETVRAQIDPRRKRAVLEELYAKEEPLEGGGLESSQPGHVFDVVPGGFLSGAGSIMEGLRQSLEIISPRVEAPKELERLERLEASISPVFMTAEEEARLKAKLFNDQMEQRMQGLKKNIKDFAMIRSQRPSPAGTASEEEVPQYFLDMDKKLADLRDTYSTGSRSRSQSPGISMLDRIRQQYEGDRAKPQQSNAPAADLKAAATTRTARIYTQPDTATASRDRSPVPKLRMASVQQEAESEPPSRQKSEAKVKRIRSDYWRRPSHTSFRSVAGPEPDSDESDTSEEKDEQYVQRLKTVNLGPGANLKSAEVEAQKGKKAKFELSVDTSHKEPVKSQRQEPASPTSPASTSSSPTNKNANKEVIAAMNQTGDASRKLGKLSMSAVLAELERAELQVYGEAFNEIIRKGNGNEKEQVRKYLMEHSAVTEDLLNDSPLMTEIAFAVADVPMDENPSLQGFMQILQELPVPTETAIHIFNDMSLAIVSTGGSVPREKCEQQAQVELELRFKPGYTWFRWDALLESAFDKAGKRIDQEKWIRHYKRAARMVRLLQMLNL
mmetsp:Transcript_71743/g.126643  ORF Transcript_71743/g.126643 Transcript_71743/m.126643 type:complete len:800 (-) Transcript_71743:66-2465(-)